jgi:mannose-6-phosphate isomerase class I
LYNNRGKKEWRNTGQYILPVEKIICQEDKYDIYPSFKISDDQVFTGFESFVEIFRNHKVVIIDGYVGVFYDHFRQMLDEVLKQEGHNVSWVNSCDFFKHPDQIRMMTAQFLGGDDPLFGKRTTLDIADFFEIERLKSIAPDPTFDINIIIGPGATLAGWPGLIIYADIPKNEIQFRARAGSVANLGTPNHSEPKFMYKCFFFVDWVVLNKHKQNIFPFINIYIDAQRPEVPVWIWAETLKKALSDMSHNVFRVRPWFEPGAWGGKWILNNITGLNKNVPNYAWSFELITPENGLLIESSSRLLEVSFDCLMYHDAEAVLGDCFPIFHTDFPIRFDFLDTFEGGNLSLQCHPRPEYIKENFEEDFPQEETYYILDNKDNAVVYLGFRDDIDPDNFREELEESFTHNKAVNPNKYLLTHTTKKHDLFLIPYGTIHSSGMNNLVLEISSTPYIYTFKMYDWLRLDLDEKPRQLNIKRGMENLFFDRKGSYVKDKLISKPEIIDCGAAWQLYNLPTHHTHIYSIHRYHFKDVIEIKTNNKCLVMNLVEGSKIIVETSQGLKQNFNYAETFVIPAAAGRIRIFNASESEAILIKAFMK